MDRRHFIKTTIIGAVLFDVEFTSQRKLKTIPINQSFFGQQKHTSFAWLGMAGAIINCRGTIILIDPLVSYGQDENTCETGDKLLVPHPVTAEQIPKADYVCYTHADSDHFAEKTAKALNRRLAPVFICPGPIYEKLLSFGVEERRLIRIKDFATYSAGNSEIFITPALHDWQKVNPWKREDCCGYLIRTPDGNIWHPGDTRLIPELEEIKNVDVLFFDVAAVDSHLGPEGSARIAETSGAKVMVAYHYGTFDLPPGSYGGCDPDDSLPYVKGMKAKFLKPDPGEVFRLSMNKIN